MVLYAILSVLVALFPFALMLAALPRLVRWVQRASNVKPNVHLALWQIAKARTGEFPEEPPRGVLPMTATARAKEQKARRGLGSRKKARRS